MHTRTRRGFTLVELMIVVVLVGILATVAFVAYRRWVASSYKAEASAVINGIATAQEARHAEAGSYLNVSGETTNLYPATKPGPFKTEWGGPCTRCMTPWTALSFKPSGPVIFGYATVASRTAVTTSPSSPGGPGGGPVGGGGGGCDNCPIETGKGPGGGSESEATPGATSDTGSSPPPSGPSATGPFYIVNAQADTDGNGVFTTAMMYSQTKHIIFLSEGE
jgi:prepilin-type N-terminal cleavage/methylation domain-containing protein